ncbi:MAG: hypothetical protein ACI9TH_000081 [Kiritimatiellia bacterium]|jgi:hypothetical protein
MTERLTYMTKRSEFTLLQQIGNSRFDFRLSQSSQRPHALQGQLPLRFNTVWKGNYLRIL